MAGEYSIGVMSEADVTTAVDWADVGVCQLRRSFATFTVS